MAALHDLISQIEDAELRGRIEQELAKFSEQKKFGLVFEEHLPECVPLYGVPIKKGCKVARKSGKASDYYTVLRVEGSKAYCTDKKESQLTNFLKQDLVCVAEFGEPIYPYLQQIDSIYSSDDETFPAHSLIEADNYHALQLLEYLYAGKADCIYIDPPYNTGARDWKYNNDYVDSGDMYRHSKWLSMMKKRLLLAKKLLNPADSVLIVTIDEKEYLHLGCLLEELFPEARIQMVTSVISAKGVVRNGQFSRVEEYIFIIEFGSSSLVPGIYNMLENEVKKESERSIEWLGFRRRAPQAKRESRPNQFYPVFVRESDGKIHSIGDVVKAGIDRNTIEIPNGCIALWPLSKDGDERLWSLVPEQARLNLSKGFLRVNNWNASEKTGTVYYLPSGTIQDIETGKAVITGHNSDGSVVAKYTDEGVTPPKRVWNMKTHNSETYGTNILNAMIGKRFNYPKSLYAVQDTLRFFVANKPNALIIDFFAGSGTTLHAVNLLNAEDGGKRQCILVTNNEVSDEEAKSLRAKGLNPGDKEWEKLGIARYVTWPRTVCSIEGHDVNGNPLKGNYIGSDIPMADGFKANAVFFKLGFLDKNSVALGRQFRELIPLLWLKAGGWGKCPSQAAAASCLTHLPKAHSDSALPAYIILPENRFAALIDETCFSEFEQEVHAHPDIQTAFLVTDFEKGFKAMSKALKISKTYQLYRDYLDNFRINVERN